MELLCSVTSIHSSFLSIFSSSPHSVFLLLPALLHLPCLSSPLLFSTSPPSSSSLPPLIPLPLFLPICICAPLLSFAILTHFYCGWHKEARRESEEDEKVSLNLSFVTEVQSSCQCFIMDHRITLTALLGVEMRARKHIP